MKRFSAVVIAAVATVAGTGWPAAGGDEDAARRELKKVAGTWRLASVEKDGRKAPDGEVKQLRLVIAGPRYTLRRAGKIFEEGTVRIDPTCNPRTINIYPTRPKGKVQLGIYKWEGGDGLRICFTHPGSAQKRPSQFSTTKGTGHVMEVCKRIKSR